MVDITSRKRSCIVTLS